MKNRVLISCVGNKVSLVNAFKKSGWHVVGTDASDQIAGRYFCDEFYRCNFDNMPDDLFSVDLVVPTYDGELMFWANKQGGINTVVSVAPPSTIYTCYHKRLFHDFAGNKLFNYQQAHQHNWRLFLQSTKNTGGSKTSHLIESLDELKYWYNHYDRSVIIQEYCDWPEYTIDLFADFNGNALSVVPRSRTVIKGGESWVGTIELNDTIVKESIKLSKNLGLLGHNTLQCFFDGKNVRWIEVNARYGGGFPLAYAAGMDTPGMLLDIVNGNEPRRVEIKDRLTMYRYTENLFV